MNLWQRIVNVVRPSPGEPRIYVSGRQAGVVVNEDTALTFAAWWACVSVISRTIAALPWGVYEKTEAGRKLVDGSVGWLLNNSPNPEMTAFSFREVLLSHVLTWGNAYAEIQRDMAGRVVALWPMTPDTVEPMRVDGVLVYRVRGETATDLPASNVLHIHGMGYDGLVGYSPVRMAARGLGMGIAQDVFGQAFYANGTTFGTLIEMPGAMNKDQIEIQEKYHNDRAKGPDKAFKVKVAPAGTKVHQTNMPMTDAQFLESRKFSVTEVCRWFGVPPHKVADLDRSTNNNIEHQGIEFVTDAIVPWAVRLEQEANTKLIGYRAQGRVYTKLLVNALMRGDAKSRAEFYRTMTQIGAMSVNEVRELEEMNSIGSSGDSHLVQLNQTTLEWLVDNPDAKAGEAKTEAGVGTAVSAAMESMAVGHRANADSVISALSSVAKTVANLALKEQPTPVFNMTSSPVNITQGDVHLSDGLVRLEARIDTPDVHNHVHVEPAPITVNAGDVHMTDGMVRLEANIDTPDVHNHVHVDAPTLMVDAPVVNVHPAITVEAPIVNVAAAEMQPPPAIQIDVHVPQAAPPDVIVQNEVNVPEQPPPHVTLEATMPPVNVTLPMRRTRSTIEHIRDDNDVVIKSTTDTIETDA